MSNSAPELLKCGDTEWCQECNAMKSAPEDMVKCLHKNDLGRCDFYTGPNMKSRNLSDMSVYDG